MNWAPIVCWKKISEEERNRIIRDYNLLSHTNKQNYYLSGLITIPSVMRRRSRNDNRPNAASFAYRVHIIKDGV